MKVIESTKYFGLLIVWMCATSCDDDSDSPNYQPTGPHIVAPETIETYSLGDIEGDFEWTLSDDAIAEIISSDGADVEVSFLRSGKVSLEVTDGVGSGNVNIIVQTTAASAMQVTFTGFGVLNEGTADTVFLTFEAPLKETPVLTLNGINAKDKSAFFENEKGKAISPFNSTGELLTDLLPYKGSDTEYYTIYEAGSGNGQPEARIESISVSDIYGGDSTDSLYIKLPLVDNLAPVGSVVLSKSIVNDDTEVVITVNFNEPVRPPMTTEADTTVFVEFTHNASVSVSDTLWATDDPAVWTMKYSVDNDGEDASVNVSVNNFVDLGGNEPAAILEATLTVDNTAPVASGEVSVADDSRVVTIETDGLWLFLPHGSDPPSGKGSFVNGNTGDAIFVAEAGKYDAYFLAIDEAGNASEIVSKTEIVVKP